MNSENSHKPSMPVMPQGLNIPQKTLFTALRIAGASLAALDFKGLRPLAHKLGAFLWHTQKKRKDMAIHNIQACLGVPEAEARDIARESFNHTAMSFFESVLIPRCTLEHPLIHVAEPQKIDELRACPTPMVLAASHLGSWELLAGMFTACLPEGRPHLVVTRRYNNLAVNAFICGLRGSHGVQVVGHREAVFSVLKVLRKRGTAAFLVDHNTRRSEAMFLPFFGRLAAVNAGPALLALRTQARVVPVCLFREQEHYVLHTEPVFETATLNNVDREQAIQTITTFYTQAVERMIRRAPEQWFWMHNRWKTQP